jgi:hypothetical protein
VSGWFTDRLRASCLSLWELGDLLGIHPHQLHHLDAGGLSVQRPIAVLIELSRRLDMHPADLVAGLDGVLTNHRLPRAGAGGEHRNDEDHSLDHTDRGAAALVVLTALAHARTPLSVDDLARALTWSLGRVQAALDYAQEHPAMAGPLKLQRVPPETFTVTPRLDLLTAGQHQAIQASTGWINILADNEAIVLLGALAYGHRPEYATFRDSDHYRHAEATLKRAGILYSDHGPHHVNVSDDVLYSLRYRDDTHIAHELGEHIIPSEPWFPNVELRADDN